MEKIEIKFSEKNTEEFYFEGQKVIVKKYISLENKYIIIANFVNTISDGLLWSNYIEAKYEMILAVVDLCTNVSISVEQENLIENIISSGLWDQIQSKIVNYNDFESEVFEILEFIIKYKNIELSENGIINKVGEKLSVLIDNVSNLDLSENGIKNLLGELKKETDKLADVYPTVKEKPVRKRKTRNITVE